MYPDYMHTMNNEQAGNGEVMRSSGLQKYLADDFKHLGLRKK